MLLAVTTGCYPVTELQRPRVVKPGHVRFAVGVGGEVRSRETYGVPTTRERQAEMDFTHDLGVRVGLFDRVDAGLRLSTSSVGVGVAVQLARAEQVGELDIKVAPEAFAAEDGAHDWSENIDDASTSVAVTGVRVPLFIGWREESYEPWVAGTFHAGRLSTYNALSTDFYALSVAAAVDFKVTSWLTLQPQIAVLAPVGMPSHLGDLHVYSFGPATLRLGADDPRFAFALNFFFNTRDD